MQIDLGILKTGEIKVASLFRATLYKQFVVGRCHN